MSPGQYQTALRSDYDAALAQYVDEPASTALRRLVEAAADADQWVDTHRKPRNRKK